MGATAQYAFIRYELQKIEKSEFKNWANEIRQIKLCVKMGSKKRSWGAPSTYIFTKDGLLIDIEGFINGSKKRYQYHLNSNMVFPSI